MILWTIQPLSVWEQINQSGVYTCDSNRFSMPEFSEHYTWLADRMAKKIGPPPVGVRFPVWAWYMQKGKRSKPDLRRERWNYGPGDENYTCIELDIPDEEVVLSDFDLWSLVLLNAFISDSDEDNAEIERCYEFLPSKKKLEYKHKNWEQIFEIKHVQNNWITRGEWIQATFWQLKKESVRRVICFKTAR